MKKIQYSFLCLLIVLSMFFPEQLAAQVTYDSAIPQVTFAAHELESAFKEAGREDLKVTLIIKPDKSSPEAFQIRRVGLNQVDVIGTDAKGAMYGGLEVADLLRLGLPLKDMEQKPFVSKRGIKFNIPWDARTPSYDDTGDAAQKNIATIYDFEFWKAFFDDMARYRYNVLTLWGSHPYPSIVKLDDYPDVAMDDVYRISDGVFEPQHRNKLQDIDIDKPGVLELVKKISIDDKIKYWQKIFNYAGDRGIEIYLFHWNVFTYGATGKYGITERQDNPVTVDYMRKSVRQALLTYPQIKGIGVTAGENADNHLKGEYSIENFLYNTYGRGMMDVLEEQPNREFRFIFRQHMSGLGPITEAFADFPGEFNTSFKYAIGHIYSMRKPLLFDRDFRNQVEEYKVPCWLNLRNDDIFVLRWGSPEFVREYIQKMPHHLSPGFYMGSDGYVWAREFIAKNPEMAGKLEIDKHWYKFRQWGLLAYNPTLGRDYWEATLKHRFPGVDGRLLYDAWAATSEVIPQLNSACFKPNDAMVSPEGCIAREGFLTVDDYFFDQDWNAPMYGADIQSVIDWGKAEVSGKKLKGMTPLEVADNLDGFAATALAALPKLKTQVGDNTELKETLNDIESMAYLGRYYADKIRGAAKLAAFRADVSQKKYNIEAVDHLKAAVEEWKAYTAIVSSMYKSQLMQRTHYMDWESILKEVEKEPQTVALEGDYPSIKIKKPSNNGVLPSGENLNIEVAVEDQHGIKDVKIYLNGLLLKSVSDNPRKCDASSDELLKSPKDGFYHLQIVAIDNTDIVSRKEINFTIGDAAKADDNWREQIYEVILEEGETLGDKEVVDFPRLECRMGLNDDARLVLSHYREGRIWQPSMHRDYKDPQFVTLENGQLKIYRGTPGDIDAELYSTPPVHGDGPLKFGITISRKLVIFRENKDEKEVVWKSHN